MHVLVAQLSQTDLKTEFRAVVFPTSGKDLGFVPYAQQQIFSGFLGRYFLYILSNEAKIS